ncbi:unnamed protein product [Lota lota]
MEQSHVSDLETWRSRSNPKVGLQGASLLEKAYQVSGHAASLQSAQEGGGCYDGQRLSAPHQPCGCPCPCPCPGAGLPQTPPYVITDWVLSRDGFTFPAADSFSWTEGSDLWNILPAEL